MDREIVNRLLEEGEGRDGEQVSRGGSEWDGRG